jgi:hypothetical protein
MSTEFSCECKLVCLKFPNAYAMKCMPKSGIILIQKVVSKTKKNKFRIEESIGSLIGTNF